MDYQGEPDLQRRDGLPRAKGSLIYQGKMNYQEEPDKPRRYELPRGAWFAKRRWITKTSLIYQEEMNYQEEPYLPRGDWLPRGAWFTKRKWITKRSLIYQEEIDYRVEPDLPRGYWNYQGDKIIWNRGVMFVLVIQRATKNNWKYWYDIITMFFLNQLSLLFYFCNLVLNGSCIS